MLKIKKNRMDIAEKVQSYKKDKLVQGNSSFTTIQRHLFSIAICFKVDKEKTFFEQGIYHGSTIDLILPLSGGMFNEDKYISEFIKSNLNTCAS